MSTISVEKAASLSTCALSAYDQTKWNLGTIMKQRTDLAGGTFIGPFTPQNFRPVETSAAKPGIMPRLIKWSATVGWMFLSDGAATGATRTEQLWLIDLTGVTTPTFVGWITITPPTGNTHVVTGHQVTYKKYSTGTCAVSGTAVTGTNTLFQTNKQCVGSRIGFGTTDPTAVTNWYNISAIGSETGATLATSAGTVVDGAYVIEDIKVVFSSKNGTAASGGIFLTKGLNYGDFTPAGSTIPAAVNTDNIKACYWLADASTVLNTAASGLAIDTETDWSNQTVYCIDSATTTNATIYVYNIRNALSNLGGVGKDFTTAGINIMKTGQQTGLTGNVAASDNLDLATPVAGHGAGNGVKALFFCTTTRWYRVVVSGANWVAAGTNFVTDVTQEVPPGGVSLYAASAALAACKYVSAGDFFIICTSNATGFRTYASKYYNDNTRLWKIFGTDDKQLDQQAAFNEGAIIHPTTQNVVQTFGVSSDGHVMMTGTGTTAVTNIGRIFPLGADAAFQVPVSGVVATTAQVVIAPVMTTTGAQTFSRAFMNNAEQLGHTITEGIGIPCEAVYTYYRLTGISDNSGTWTKLADNDDMSAIAGASSIQFLYAFRCIGLTSIPSRLFAVGVTYNDFTSIPQYAFSAEKSSAASKYFAFYFKTAFSSTVPALRIIIKDTDSGSTLVDDNTTTPTGTWEKTTDGTSWVTWTNADRGNATTWLRYTPLSMSDNVKATPILGLL
jgi:hypothetical protein